MDIGYLAQAGGPGDATEQDAIRHRVLQPDHIVEGPDRQGQRGRRQDQRRVLGDRFEGVPQACPTLKSPGHVLAARVGIHPRQIARREAGGGHVRLVANGDDRVVALRLVEEWIVEVRIQIQADRQDPRLLLGGGPDHLGRERHRMHAGVARLGRQVVDEDHERAVAGRVGAPHGGQPLRAEIPPLPLVERGLDVGNEAAGHEIEGREQRDLLEQQGDRRDGRGQEQVVQACIQSRHYASTSGSAIRACLPIRRSMRTSGRCGRPRRPSSRGTPR